MAWAATGIVLTLAGCGDVSLVDALKGDSPGELRLSPSTALVPESTDFTFTIQGGILPYEILVGSVIPKGDAHTWVFPGITIDGDSEAFTIQATDLLGDTATAVVTVYSLPPLTINASEITLVEGGSWTFVVTGGKPPYSWSLDDVPVVPAPMPDDRYPYTNASVGSHTVSVTDAIGVSQAATVTVVPLVPGAPLEISPTETTVEVGGTVYFTALGGTGSYRFQASDGSITATANPATYTAPNTAGPQTVSLSDDGGATFPVTAGVNVVPAAETLVLSPDSPTVSAIGDTIQFTAAGGTAPYKFSTGKPEEGTINPTTGFYTQLGIKNVLVTVRDSAGLSDNTLVKFK